MKAEPTMECTWRGLEELEPILRAFLAARCRGAAEVDDVVQETFLRAARYRTSLHDPRSLRGWTLRIAANVLRDHIRREARLPRLELLPGDLDGVEGREPEPGEVDERELFLLKGEPVARNQILAELSKAVDGLRLPDRVVLRAFYDSGRRGGAVASECGIPRRLVKLRVFRARRRLSRALEQTLGGQAHEGARLRPGPEELAPLPGALP